MTNNNRNDADANLVGAVQTPGPNLEGQAQTTRQFTGAPSPGESRSARARDAIHRDDPEQAHMRQKETRVSSDITEPASGRRDPRMAGRGLERDDEQRSSGGRLSDDAREEVHPEDDPATRRLLERKDR